MGNSISEVYTYLSALLPDVNLYFQPPESVKINYPCIVYSIDNIFTAHADNRPYKVKTRYSLMLITTNPEDPALQTLISIPSARFERSYVNDNLYHFIVTVHDFI